MEIVIENKNSDINGTVTSSEHQNSPLPSCVVDKQDKGANIHLEWIGLNVDVVLPNTSCFGRCQKKQLEETKHVLKDVSGTAESGSLLAIMGASGAGKTTLLNVLSRLSLSTLRLSGSVLVNNKNIKNKIKSMSAYVTQEEVFIGTLTVHEHLTFQALLRMGKQYSIEERKKRVIDVITDLGLVKCQNTIIGVPGRIPGISGGELKRLSFASEIITDTNLLFVDEPTSGLDSFMAESVVAALQRLAKEGRTILATVHQPSSSVFELFDRLLLLSEGRTAFLGSTNEAVQFFDKIGYPCPINYNPADHYIRTLAIIPGNEEECIAKSNSICDAFHKEESELQTWVDNEDIEYEEARQPCKEGALTQFKAIVWRATKAIHREPSLNKIKFIQCLVIGVITGLVYLQQPQNLSGVININGVIFFLIINLSFSSVMSSALVFPMELPVFLKENKIGMYRSDVYFIGRTLAEIPWYTVGTIAMCTIVYWMAGLRAECATFFIFLGICILMQQVCVSYAYLISAIAPTPQIAVAISAPLILPSLLFGGFFLKDESIPIYFIWLKVFSWMKYAFAALQINQWEHFGPLNCKNGSEGCLSTGLAVLQMNGYDPNDFHANIAALLGLMVGFRIIAFCFILLRVYRTK